MEIRPVELDDDAVMQQVAAVTGRSWLEGRPHAPAYDPVAQIANLRSPDSGERQVLVAAYAGGRVLGVGTAWLFVKDNVEKAWFEVDVDPAERRAGIGSALLAHLVEVARAEGRTVLIIDAKLPFGEVESHHQRRFAERHGFSLSNTEVVRHQQVPVADGRLDAWEERAARRASGYRIETHVNEMPEALVPSLCVLLGQLGVDAPTGAVDFEEEVVDAQRLAERYASAEAMGSDLLETVALTPDGVVAAQSTLSVPRARPDAFQWGTFVHREHRGHSLGLAVKVANLRELQARHPHVRRVVTQNAETNDWMIAINELMGYEPVEVSAEFVCRI